jgi:charged multivesicular body protein 4
LNEELAELEQEQLDNKMLKTGTVPVSDEIHRLPAAVNGERKCFEQLAVRWVSC